MPLVIVNRMNLPLIFSSQLAQRVHSSPPSCRMTSSPKLVSRLIVTPLPYGTRLIHQVLVKNPYAYVQDTLSIQAFQTCDAPFEAISVFAHYRSMACTFSANGMRVSVIVVKSRVPMSPPFVHSITSGIMQGRSQPLDSLDSLIKLHSSVRPDMERC